MILEKKSKIAKENPHHKSKAIIFLYGTSTSGKSTICKNLQNLISNLKVDSTDSAFKKFDEHNFEKALQYLNDNKKNFSNIKHLLDIFTITDICNGILNGHININNREVLFMFDLDESKFERMLEETLGTGFLIEKKAIITLRKVAKSYFEQLYISVHENMFGVAISNAIQGLLTILDIVPHPARSGQFMIDLFQDQLKQRNYTGLTHIALIHCSIPQLSARIIERNRQARIRGALEDIRDEPFPFRQYAQLFSAANHSKNKHLGQLNINDAKKALAPFCTNSAEVEKIIEQIGFTGQSDEMKIDTKCNFDKIYDSGLQTAAEIAEKISKVWE